METEKLILVSVVGSIAVVGFLIGFAFLSFEPTNTNPTHQTPTTIREDIDLIDLSLKAPDWNLLMSDGEILTIESMRGKFILVDLMSRLCSACSTQNGNLAELDEDFSDDALVIISLSVDISDTAAMIDEYMTTKGLSWQHGLDTNGVFTDYFDVVYIPTMVIIDSDGYFRWLHVGIWTTSAMAETLSLMMR